MISKKNLSGDEKTTPASGQVVMLPSFHAGFMAGEKSWGHGGRFRWKVFCGGEPFFSQES
jgi:hypothetical protein